MFCLRPQLSGATLGLRPRLFLMVEVIWESNLHTNTQLHKNNTTVSLPVDSLPVSWCQSSLPVSRDCDQVSAVLTEPHTGDNLWGDKDRQVRHHLRKCFTWSFNQVPSGGFTHLNVRTGWRHTPLTHSQRWWCFYQSSWWRRNSQTGPSEPGDDTEYQPITSLHQTTSWLRPYSNTSTIVI